MHELSKNGGGKCVAGEHDKTAVEKNKRVRNLYVLVGHGVPNSLLEHFISSGRKWLQCPSLSSTDDAYTINKEPSSEATSLQHTSSAIQLSLCNISNSTLMDPNKILKTSANGTTASINWPLDWEHDLELFMVVMNRIGSRLSSVAAGGDKEYDNDNTVSNVSVAQGTGSVIIPSNLQQWNVAIRKGEVLPFDLLPSPTGSVLGTCQKYDNSPQLVVEFSHSAFDCWKVVLRLQDEGIDMQDAPAEFRKDPMSLIFEGVYDSPR